MVIPDGGGGGSFEGINPELLAQLMRYLSSGANDGQQVAGSYVWQFQRLGLDTSALTRLQQDYEDLQLLDRCCPTRTSRHRCS